MEPKCILCGKELDVEEMLIAGRVSVVLFEGPAWLPSDDDTGPRIVADVTVCNECEIDRGDGGLEYAIDILHEELSRCLSNAFALPANCEGD